MARLEVQDPVKLFHTGKGVFGVKELAGTLIPKEKRGDSICLIVEYTWPYNPNVQRMRFGMDNLSLAGLGSGPIKVLARAVAV